MRPSWLTWRLIAIFCVAVFSVGLAAAEPPSAIRVSADGRSLERADDTPFFYLGDTAWELFHRATCDEAREYLTKRAEQKFTVIQAVVLAEFDGLRVPNALGERPLLDNDPLKPNNKYFEHVDWIVAEANRLGLVVGMLPTWGDKFNRKWGAGPEIFVPDNARQFGEYLGKRYANADLIWILGGDRPLENDQHRAVVEAMAAGLRAGDSGKHLMSFHPCGGQSSAQYFHEAPWLDFNMRQDGHVADSGRYLDLRKDYDRQPTKPVMDAEPLYEDHPINFNAAEFGHSVAADVRRAAYWGMFAGGFGHTYGHHSIWQFWTPDRQPINAPLCDWRTAMDRPGANQMQHLRALFESLPSPSEPDDSLLVPTDPPTAIPGAGRYRFAARVARDCSWGMVYAPVSRGFTVDLTKLSPNKLRAVWFDVRTGATSGETTVTNQSARAFNPPTPGEELDWVLIVEDAQRGG